MDATDFIKKLAEEKDLAAAMYDEKVQQISKDIFDNVFVSINFIEAPSSYSSSIEGEILVSSYSCSPENKRGNISLPLTLIISFSLSLGRSNQDTKIKIVKPCPVKLTSLFHHCSGERLIQDLQSWKNVKKFPLAKFKNLEDIVSKTLSLYCVKNNNDNWNYLSKNYPSMPGMHLKDKEVFLHDSFIKHTNERLVDLLSKGLKGERTTEMENYMFALNLNKIIYQTIFKLKN
jgi:hypothetical protein